MARSSTRDGYNYRWQVARAAFLREHPLCECPECDGGRRRIRAATIVDHIKPHRGDQTLFWDRSNWQAMAKRCHDRKTATVDRGRRARPTIGIDGCPPGWAEGK